MSFAALSFCTILAACGGGGDDTAQAPAPTPTPPPAPTPGPGPGPAPTPPTAPGVNIVEGDDIVSIGEAADGVVITGSAEPGVTVNVSWSASAKQAVADSAGGWWVQYAQGELPPNGSSTVSAFTSNNGLSSGPTQRQVSMRTSPPATSLNILAIGDSMTKGDEDNDNPAMCVGGGSYRTWRGTLQTELTSAGYTFDFSGPKQTTPASGGSDPDHAGYGGATIDAFPVGHSCRTLSTTPTSDGNGNGNLVDRLNEILPGSNSPDLIIVSGLGWNSINCDATSSTPADQFTTFVNELTSRRPNAKILLATVPPQQGQTEAQTTAAKASYGLLNTRIRDTAAANNQIFLADVAAESSFTSAEYYDSIHHCQPAADKVADKLMERVNFITF